MSLFSSFRTTKESRVNQPIWDDQLYKRLIEDTDEVTATLIWQSFRNALGVSIKDWKDAVAAKNYSQIRQIAHKIRSSSMLLGFKDFAGLSQKIEQNLADNVANSDLSADLSQWIDQAEAVFKILNEEPQGSLGQQPVAFTKNGVDANR